MRAISAVSDKSGRIGTVAGLLSLVLGLWTAAPPYGEVPRLETSTDAQRNAREWQKQIDELSDSVTERRRMLARGDVLFASGSAELDTVSRADLEELARFLIKYPGHIARIEGHADDAGTDDDNQALSQRRAEAVKSYLVRSGVNPRRLLLFGRGERLPVAQNGFEQGRQQNRRAGVMVENSLVSLDHGQ